MQPLFPAQSSSLWDAYQWDILDQVWPLLSSCGNPSPRHSTWHITFVDICCADPCTYLHLSLCSRLYRAPLFAACTVCGHTEIVWKWTVLCIPVLNLTIKVGSCLTVQGTSLGETGFGGGLGMPVGDLMSRGLCGMVAGCPTLGGVSMFLACVM